MKHHARRLSILPLSLFLLTGCLQTGAQSLSAPCIKPGAIPSDPPELRSRLSGDPRKDAKLLARSLAQWKSHDRKLLGLLVESCRAETLRGTSGTVCSRLSALPPPPHAVRDHLSTHGVEDSLLLAVALREWQAHAGTLQAALPICR